MTSTEARHNTALVLMKSPEADAIIDALGADPAVHVQDLGSYWKLTGAGDIRVDQPCVRRSASYSARSAGRYGVGSSFRTRRRSRRIPAIQRGWSVPFPAR